MRVSTAVLTAAVLSWNPLPAFADETIYASLQTLETTASGEQGATFVGFHAVRVRPAAKGARQVTARPLWAQTRMMGYGEQQTFDLDPDDAVQRPLLDAVRSGFQTTVSATGDAGPLRAIDSRAWAAATRAVPQAKQWEISTDQLLGMLPQALPVQWTVGQTLRHTTHSHAHGVLKVEQTVSTLTPDVAVVDFTVRGKGLQGEGRQAIQRRDGMPIETRATLRRDAIGGLPATTQVAHVADLAYEPFLEPMSADMYRANVASTTQQLAQPPYTAPTGRSEDYKRYPVAVGELEDWMVPASALPDFEKSLRFALLPGFNASRPTLAIGAEAELRKGTKGNYAIIPPALTVRPQAVTLLGRDNAPLPDLDAVRTLSSLQIPGRYKAEEGSPSFPFRLPLNATDQARDRLHRIRMTVDVEVHRWEGMEVIAPGEASVRNPDVRIEMPAPHRITVLHPRARPSAPNGIWTAVIPLDANGQEIPTADLAVGPYQHTVGTAGLPLVWEFGTQPYQSEIAAERPIAALQLRHYGWETLRREWEFWRAGDDGQLLDQ